MKAETGGDPQESIGGAIQEMFGCGTKVRGLVGNIGSRWTVGVEDKEKRRLGGDLLSLSLSLQIPERRLWQSGDWPVPPGNSDRKRGNQNHQGRKGSPR